MQRRNLKNTFDAKEDAQNDDMKMKIATSVEKKDDENILKIMRSESITQMKKSVKLQEEVKYIIVDCELLLC